ncbi:MAG: SusC/RagA family TonB-linked outer membrane protein [Mucilaginibacter sp.]|nr:SusC/RagA family TonB-linked outer membrane protein [Mucilaginibacter sp.]
MKQSLLIIFLLFALGTTNVSAQNKTVKGTVIGADDGQSIPGVSVTIQGTGVGTQTDVQGGYSIKVPAGAQSLTFSYVGYASQTVVVGSQSVINIKLVQDSKALNEVVVTALGIERDKRSLNYSVQEIKGSQLSNRGEPNLLNLLQGKVAGVQITGASGSAGASTNINIRGIHSFTGGNQPLFVVDGVPISNDVDRTNGGSLGTNGDNQPSNRALDINPDNIESVNVLKGAAAAALYGSRASNGVIVVTTKKGGNANKKAEVTFSSTYETQKVYGIPELQTDYGQGTLGAYVSTSGNSWGPKFGSTPSTLNGLITAAGATVPYQLYANNIKDFFKTGSLLANTVNISNGDKDKNFSVSIANTRQSGILPNTDLNRTNVQFNMNTVLANKLRAGASIAYSNTANKGVLGGNGSSTIGSLFVPRSYDLQGLPYKDANGKNVFFAPGVDNPYFDAYENPLKSNVDRLIGNINVNYDVLPWLNISYRIGMDTYFDRRKQIFAISSARVPAGQVLEDNFYRSEVNSDLIVRASKKNLFLDNLNASVLVGQNINQRKFQNTTLQGDNLTIPGFYNASNATVFTNGSGETNNTRRLLGVYGQLSVDYNSYLFLELTGRQDQSSTLPVGNNTYFYPAASLGFVFTDAFKINSSILSYGKLRASIAKVGKDADPYLLNSVYVTAGYGNNVALVTFPLNGVSGFTTSSRIGSNTLTPEFTTSYEFGTNLGLFHNALTIDFTYFNSKSKNQIIDVAIPTSTGYNTFTTNVGQLNNSGFEALISGTPVQNRNFKWDVSLNYTRTRNKVIAIAPGITSFPIPGSKFTGTIPSINLNEPYGIILGNKNPTSPDGQFIINPATGTFAPALAGQKIANPNPDYLAGITNTFNYKGLVLSFLFDTQQGGDIVSFSAATYRGRGLLKMEAIDREQPRILPGVIQQADGTFKPNNIQIAAQTYWQSFGTQTDVSVFDATTYRLRELSLGYTIPKSMLGRLPFGNITFSLIGRNLFYKAPNSPIDPEVNTAGASNIRGLELQSAPNSRSYGFNLRFTL